MPDVERRQRVGFTVFVLGATDDQVEAVAKYIYEHGVREVAAAAAENVHLRREQVLPTPVADFRRVDTINRLRAGQRVRTLSGWTGEVLEDVERNDDEFQGGTVRVKPIVYGRDWEPMEVTIGELQVIDVSEGD